MSINPLNSTNQMTGSNNNRIPSSELGKDDFLNLLVTQLKYQDPLSPMDNTEYVAQLAQFSTLEHMENMSSGISYMEALTMTGKYITGTVVDTGTGDSEGISGVVDSVKLKSGSVTLLVQGVEVRLEDITDVQDYNRSDTASLSSLIGQTCEGYIYNSENLDLIGVKGKVTGIAKGAYEDYAVMDGVLCEVESILSEDYSSSQSMLEYLQGKLGSEIDIDVTDSETGKIVPVTAELESVYEEDGELKVKLNGVNVPVDGLFKIGE
ncbi:MAG TPA: flagellar hook capping FlgD N-terminal domain-containing protein [Clostridia bacterium]|nr:flagellar hook capping FlgD N-terminal domain-containing protein [Clostridia bacterium]